MERMYMYNPNTADNSASLRAQPVINQMRGFMSKGEYYNAISCSDNIITQSPMPTSSASSSASNNNNTNTNANSSPEIMNLIERERIYCLRAECYLALKQFSKCEKEARGGIQASESSSPQAQFLLGCALLGLFKISESVDAFDVAESLMKSPQPWKYVVLPNELVQSQQQVNNNSNNNVPRQYRDVGIDDASKVAQNNSNNNKINNNNNNNNNFTILLPPPPVTYEWTNSLTFWRNEAAMARKLYQAQTTRLLSSRSDLVQGVRMLEQVAKQTASKFLIITLRNDTDYDLVYQFHTCGSEAANNLKQQENDKNKNSNNSRARGEVSPNSEATALATQSQTQYLMRFPHTIPSNGVGVAVLYSDSWRAKTITLNSTVTFAIENNNGRSNKKISTQMRFSFSLSSVMNNVTSDVTVIQQQQQQQQHVSISMPASASTFSFDDQAITVFASNQTPNQVYSRSQMGSGFSGTQSDVAKIPAVYLAVVQTLGSMKIPQNNNNNNTNNIINIQQTKNGASLFPASTNKFSTVLVASIAQYLPSRPLRLAAGVSQTWRNVVSSFPPSRFDDFPFTATFPDYCIGRDVRSSPFTVRIPSNISLSSSSSSSNMLPQWIIKREDTPMFKVLSVKNSRGDPILYFIGDPGKGNDYISRLPGGIQGRCLLCRISSTQGFFSSKRTADVLWANNSSFLGEVSDSENLASVKTAKIIHRFTGGGDEVLIVSVHMKSLADEQTLEQQQKNGVNGAAAANSNNIVEEHNLPGLELVAPRYQSLVRPASAGNNNNNKGSSSNPPLVSVRDVSSKHTVATLEPMPNSASDPQLRGSQVLKFLSQTDGFFCALLAAEYLVSW